MEAWKIFLLDKVQERRREMELRLKCLIISVSLRPVSKLQNWEAETLAASKWEVPGRLLLFLLHFIWFLNKRLEVVQARNRTCHTRPDHQELFTLGMTLTPSARMLRALSESTVCGQSEGFVQIRFLKTVYHKWKQMWIPLLLFFRYSAEASGLQDSSSLHSEQKWTWGVLKLRANAPESFNETRTSV